jgi:hypothetical protein
MLRNYLPILNHETNFELNFCIWIKLKLIFKQFWKVLLATSSFVHGAIV